MQKNHEIKYYTHPNEKKSGTKRTEEAFKSQCSNWKLRSNINVPFIEPHFKDKEKKTDRKNKYYSMTIFLLKKD